MTRTAARRMRAAIATVFAAGVAGILGSVWLRLHTTADPTWIGLGLVGVALLSVAVALEVALRRP